MNKKVTKLSKQFSELNQEENTYTFGLNLIKSTDENQISDITYEPGNELCYALPAGYSQIGDIYLQDGKVAIFSTNDINSRLDVIDKECNVTNIFDTGCFGFSKKYTISGESLIINGCENVITWADKLNPDYYINLDNLEDFKTDGEWDCNKAKFVPDIQIIKAELQSVNESGGNLPLGTYSFQFEILDSDLNTIQTSETTAWTPIYDETLNTSFTEIDGGYNIEQYDSLQGGVPTTTKTITIALSNIDTKYAFIRVNVIRAINGDMNNRSAHAVGNLIPITGDTGTFTYTGYYPNNGDYDLDYSQVINRKPEYKVSLLHEQVQGRFLRANLIEDIRNYKAFQQSASKIFTQWVTEFVPHKNMNFENYKNPNTYWFNQSFMRDEIYGLGIVYIFSDGRYSPVFHIPGRCATDFDRQLITVVPDNQATLTNFEIRERDVKYLGLSINDTVERWKVENTAIDGARAKLSGEASMAYWEASDPNAIYPEIDCVEDYWGFDHCGNRLNGTPVRHHKFPDNKESPIASQGGIFKVGVEFFNIEYPSSDIIGHFFVAAERRETDKTILDKGYTFYNYHTEELTGNTPVSTLDGIITGDPLFVHGRTAQYDKSMGFHSPNLYFNNRMERGNYFNFEKRWEIPRQNTPGRGQKYHEATIKICPDQLIDNNDQMRFKFTGAFLNWEDDVDLNINSLQIQDTVLLKPEQTIDTFGSFIEPIYNRSFDNPAGILNFEFQPTGDQASVKYQTYYGAIKTIRDVYTNLFALNYYRIHNMNYDLTTSENLGFGGDTFINQFDFLTGTYREVNNTFYDYNHQMLARFYYEADFNVDLRHESEFNKCTQYFKYNYSGWNEDFKRAIMAHFESIYTVENTDTFLRCAVTDQCERIYLYNTDYSNINNIDPYFPLPFNFNYCSECIKLKKNKIIYSPKQFSEDKESVFRLNYADDYIELPYNKGSITGLKYKNNRLLVHTEQTTFVYQPNPQYLSTETESAYLTTGDFLSIPPNELSQTDLGFGGLQFKDAIVDTEIGYIWVDSDKGQIILLADKLEILSNTDLTQWLIENLRFELDKQWVKNTGNKYPDRVITSDKGIGVQLVYDYRFKRLIIHKKDYKILNEENFFRSSNPYQDLDLSYDAMYTGKPSIEDKSWTLSFSLADRTWTSWHSYKPNFMFENEYNFFTTNGNKVYKHLHKGKYGEFYGKKHPFIIDIPFVDYETSNADGFYYIAKFTNNDVIQDKTFNKVWIYNNYQSTGMRDLKLASGAYDNLFIQPTELSVIETDLNYKISNIWDKAVARDIESDDWNNINQTYFNYGYIDKVPINTNYLKNPYESGQFRDKICNLRLIYEPDTEDTNIVLNLSIINNYKSRR